MANISRPEPSGSEPLAGAFPSKRVGRALGVEADSLEWLGTLPAYSLHAVVTDPPYGLEEYEPHQVNKLRNGNKGGIWRLPPSFDGSNRQPLPRFTALNLKQRNALREFFTEWSRLTLNALRPGGHVFIAGNAFLSQLVWSAVVEGGLEFRGEVIRLVRTFRGGDRPKGAHDEFEDVCSMPRACFEPWGLFRSPLPKGAKVSDCLREYETGGIRRLPSGSPFLDVIPSERTPKIEKAIINHPSLKPQSLMRQLVYASLPLGKGVVADTFMGGGSTLAAANALGLDSIGVERDHAYFKRAMDAVPKLAALSVKNDDSTELSLELD